MHGFLRELSKIGQYPAPGVGLSWLCSETFERILAFGAMWQNFPQGLPRSLLVR